MASIQRVTSSLTGEVRYRAQMRVKGRPSESQTFPSKKEAKEWAQALESAIRQGRNFPHAAARRTDFAALLERYRKTGGALARPSIATSTLSRMFSVALMEWRLVERNPVRDVTKRMESRGRTRFLIVEGGEI